MKWCIYYDDESIFSSDWGRPEDAPLDGVLYIAQQDDSGKVQVYRGPDYYYWTGDSWAAGSLADLERWLRRDARRLKYGRWSPNSIWEKIRARVKSEWLDKDKT